MAFIFATGLPFLSVSSRLLVVAISISSVLEWQYSSLISGTTLSPFCSLFYSSQISPCMHRLWLWLLAKYNYNYLAYHLGDSGLICISFLLSATYVYSAVIKFRLCKVNNHIVNNVLTSWARYIMYEVGVILLRAQDLRFHRLLGHKLLAHNCYVHLQESLCHPGSVVYC